MYIVAKCIANSKNNKDINTIKSYGLCVLKKIHKRIKIQIQCSSYGGTADQLLALRQGEVDFSCAKLGDVEPLIRGNNAALKLLGVYSEKRLDSYKDVPTWVNWVTTINGTVPPVLW